MLKIVIVRITKEEGSFWCRAIWVSYLAEGKTPEEAKNNFKKKYGCEIVIG